MALRAATARGTSGTQPVSFTLRVNGVTWATAVPLGSSMGPGMVLPIAAPSSVVSYAAPSQIITATPLAATAGSCLFDLVGYYF